MKYIKHLMLMCTFVFYYQCDCQVVPYQVAIHQSKDFGDINDSYQSLLQKVLFGIIIIFKIIIGIGSSKAANSSC